MSRKISKITYSRFRKQELPEFIVSVIDAGEKCDPASLQLEAALEKAKEALTLMDELQMLELGHPLTPELQVAYQSRNNYIEAIRGQVKAARKANLPDKREAVKQAEVCVKKYFNATLRRGSDEKSRIVKLYIAEVKGGENLTAAFEALGLSAVIANLETVQAEISSKSLVRRDDKGVKPKTRTNEVTKELISILKGYFGAIEAASFIHSELDYSNLINTINEDILRFRGLFSLRISTNKQKNQKATEAADSIEEQAS